MQKKNGGKPSEITVFCKKKLFLFMINYVLKGDKLLIPYNVYFFSIKLGSSKLRTKSYHRVAMG